MSASQLIHVRQETNDSRVERSTIFQTFFRADRVELLDDGSMKLQFNAQALDGSSEEKFYTILHVDNTPEKNMEILLDARKRQNWYTQKRAETPGLDIPPSSAKAS